MKKTLSSAEDKMKKQQQQKHEASLQLKRKQEEEDRARAQQEKEKQEKLRKELAAQRLKWVHSEFRSQQILLFRDSSDCASNVDELEMQERIDLN